MWASPGSSSVQFSLLILPMRTPLLLFALLAGSCAPEPERLDVLIVVADDLASKAIGAFGGEWIETPHIDRLVESGFAFDRAVCASPFCTPSRQAFLTGRWPHSIGVTQIGSSLPPDSNTMGTIFSAAGYRTAAIGKMHWGEEFAEATYGFDLVAGRPDWLDQLDAAEQKRHDEYWRIWDKPTRERWSQLNPDGEACPLEEDRQLAPWLIDRLFAFLEEDEKPALAFLSFHEPHAPFTFPPRLANAVDPAGLSLPAFDVEAVQKNAPGLAKALDNRVRVLGALDEEIRRGAVASYLCSVKWLDEEIGHLLDRLEAAGRLDSTLIVFWSDNGFFLGERGLVGKNYPYREAAEVPVAIAGPEIPRGRSDALVQLLDVLPTLCELTDVPPPTGLQGASLVPLLHGADAVRDQAFCEFVGLVGSLQTKDYRLMIGSRPGQGWDLLYDLNADPTESLDLFADPALRRVRAGLLRRMYDLLASTPADGIPPDEWMTQADGVQAIRWALRQIDAKKK